MFELIKFINDWQKENDSEFKLIPIDNHSKIILNYYNTIIEFIFSSKEKRDKCRREIPINLVMDFSLFMEQDNGFAYYSIKKDDEYE